MGAEHDRAAVVVDAVAGINGFGLRCLQRLQRLLDRTVQRLNDSGDLGVNDGWIESKENAQDDKRETQRNTMIAHDT